MNIPIIDPRTVFTIATLTETLGLKKGTIPRELRLKRLRYTKRAGRVWITGEAVWEWLQGAEPGTHTRKPNTVNGKA